MNANKTSGRTPGTAVATLTSAVLLAALLAGCSSSVDPTTPNGAADRALALDGVTGRVKDIGSASDWNFITQTGTFTVEAMVRFADPSVAKLQAIAATSFTKNANGFLFGLENREGSGQRALRLIITDGTRIYAAEAVSGPDAITDCDWHAVAVVVDDYIARFYVDGVSAGNVSSRNPDLRHVDGTWALRLGDAYSEFADSDDFHLQGALDEVRVWNRALTLGEIVANATFPVAPDDLVSEDPGLVGYWPCDEMENLGVGTAGANDLRDFSAAGHAGDVAGGATLVNHVLR